MTTTNKEMKNGGRTQWKQWLGGITATLTMVSIGTVYGWATTNLSRLTSSDSHIVMTTDQTSWIVSLTGIGSMIGPFLGAAAADKVGPRNTLLLTSLFFSTGWLIDIFATKVAELYVARVILGIGIGISYTTNPMYISGIADVNIRGALGTLTAVNVFIGSLSTCIIGPFIAVRTLSIILLAVPVLFVILFIWFPETPGYLAWKGHNEKAIRSLLFYKGMKTREEAEEELNKVILNLEKNANTENWPKKLRKMLLPNNRKALGILLVLIITQSMSGNYTTMAYLEVLFQTADIGIDTNLATVIVLIVGLMAAALATVTIERIGRRMLLITSTSSSFVVLGLLATYLVANANGIDLEAVNWLPVFLLVVFQVTYQLGIGALPDALIGELFPADVMSIGSASATISDGILGLIISKLYTVIGEALGEYVTYYIFSGSCFLALIFVILFVPETMNKDFNQIQEELADSRLQCFRKKERK